MLSNNKIISVKTEPVIIKNEISDLNMLVPVPEFVSVNPFYPIIFKKEDEKKEIDKHDRNELDNDNSDNHVNDNDIIEINDSDDASNEQEDSSNYSDCSDNELMLNIINNACTIIETTAVVEENSVLSPEKNDSSLTTVVIDDSGLISAKTDSSGVTPVINDTRSVLSQDSNSDTLTADEDDLTYYSESDEFETEICNRIFQGDSDNIIKDNAVDPASSNNCFVCNTYSENFNHEYSSRKLCDLCYQHLSTTGVSEEPLKCKSCNTEFAKKFYYDGHICHNNNSADKYGNRYGYTCKLCKRYCNKFKDYITHIKYKHDSANCQFCKRIFHENSHLYIHIKLCHTNKEKPYKCLICGKSFIYKRNFNVHFKLHTSGFPYKCLYCEKAFRLKRIMKNHLKSHWKN